MSDSTPSNPPQNAAGDGQRSTSGKFSKGNKIGKGNPHAKRVQALRAALLKSVTTKDVRDVMAALLTSAKAGDTVAIKEFLTRVFGPAVQIDLLERLEQMEQRLGDGKGKA